MYSCYFTALPWGTSSVTEIAGKPFQKWERKENTQGFSLGSSLHLGALLVSPLAICHHTTTHCNCTASTKQTSQRLSVSPQKQLAAQTLQATFRSLPPTEITWLLILRHPLFPVVPSCTTVSDSLLFLKSWFEHRFQHFPSKPTWPWCYLADSLEISQSKFIRTRDSTYSWWLSPRHVLISAFFKSLSRSAPHWGTAGGRGTSAPLGGCPVPPSPLTEVSYLHRQRKNEMFDICFPYKIITCTNIYTRLLRESLKSHLLLWC